MKNGSVGFPSLFIKSQSEQGFVYLWALFSVVLAGVAIAGAGQMWQVKSQRDKEAELMFIGEEFRKAIMSYHNTTKQYPSSLEELLKDSRSVNIKRHLRKIYVDPMTNTTDWGLVDEPPPATTTATSKAGAAQDKSSTSGSGATSSTGSSSGSSASTGNTSSSTTNPNQTSALNQAGSTGQTTGQTSTTTPGSNVGTTQESKPPTTSSSGMSSSIGKKITGVYSLSERKPIKKDRFPEQYAKFKEALTYRDWQFVYKPDAKSSGTSGTGSGSGASSTKSGGAAAAGASNSPFSPSTSSSRGGASSSSGASPGASPFGSPSQPTAPRGGASSPFGSSADDD